MIPPFLPSQALIKERGDSDEENRQCLYVCVSIFFNRKQTTTHGNWNIRGFFPAPCPHCHSMGTYALNITHVPFSFPEVPPFGSPYLSHTSQPQPLLSYKKEAWDQESSPSPAGPDHSPSQEGAWEGLSAHLQPLAPTTPGAVGQPPLHIARRNTAASHSAPSLPSSVQDDRPPTPAVLEICSWRREGGEKAGFKELLLLLQFLRQENIPPG